MLAGLTRLIEVCYFVPKILPAAEEPMVPSDDSSDHTLAESRNSSRKDAKSASVAGATAWRHLTPFVRNKISGLSVLGGY